MDYLQVSITLALLLLMEELLRAEGVEVKEDQIVDFKKHLFLFDHEG
jgi:uncharacterized membrane protein